MTLPIVLPDGDPGQLGFIPDRLEQLRLRLDSYIAERHYAGVSVLIARDGRIAHFSTHGHRDLENSLPMERDTIVRIYSMTKIPVSVAALMLFEEGRFRLGDPLSLYLPEFAAPMVVVGRKKENSELIPAAQPILIKNLFNHTAGFVYPDAKGNLAQQIYHDAPIYEASSLADLVTRLSKLPLSQQPGEAFCYGFSTDVLGRVIEVITGKRLDEVLMERIFGPLAMNDTAYAIPPSKRHRLAAAYRETATNSLERIASFNNEDEPGVKRFPEGGTGLFSTIDDYAKFAETLRQGGQWNGVRLLGRKTLEFMTANHLSGLRVPYHSFTPGYGFGLGVETRVDHGQAMKLGSIGDFGWSGWLGTICRIDPQERLVAICYVQHLPLTEYKLSQLFMNLVYQALT
ncbi:MAG: beta-lactamase family protein [Verrucomicrobia bacterium]|nr:beta-lactamase family protein [Verrucomicrobiota bacterium]